MYICLKDWYKYSPSCPFSWAIDREISLNSHVTPLWSTWLLQSHLALHLFIIYSNWFLAIFSYLLHLLRVWYPCCSIFINVPLDNTARKRVHGISKEAYSWSHRGSLLLESPRKRFHGISEEACPWNQWRNVSVESARKHVHGVNKEGCSWSHRERKFD